MPTAEAGQRSSMGHGRKKLSMFIAIAAAVCSYLWITREMCFQAWLISRLCEMKFMKEVLHPNYFVEKQPDSDVDPDRAMNDRRTRIDTFVGTSIAKEDPAEVHDVVVDVKGGQIPLRVYIPASLDPPNRGWAGRNSKGVLIWLHGGAWIFGSPNSADVMSKDMAAVTGRIVVSVGYRLAPEVKFPVPLKDCLAAVRWVKSYIEHFGGDKNRVALVGESSGGNLAMATALFLGRTWFGLGGGGARKALCAVVAASPPLSYQHAVDGRGGEDDGEWRSYRRYWQGYGLDGEQMKGYWDTYLKKPKDGQHIFASPLRASKRHLGRLPPVLLLRAAHEILWDEITEMGRKIADAGGEVEEMQSQACIHGMYAKGTSACGTKSLEATKVFLDKHCG